MTSGFVTYCHQGAERLFFGWSRIKLNNTYKVSHANLRRITLPITLTLSSTGMYVKIIYMTFFQLQRCDINVTVIRDDEEWRTFDDEYRSQHVVIQ